MKLRIRGNSIRVRLMQTEVKDLLDQGRIQEEVHFPDGTTWVYQCVADHKYDATVKNNFFTVTAPTEILTEWSATEGELSLEASLDLPNGEMMRILIEKDLRCLTDRKGEDETDAYPNPATENC